uniref:Uncharacterized protein n=1 Tax=uncultured marine microorganism HF4000_48F7 TaxID=455500 RepID=B3SZT9_9ZZZZ|nr:hypothetical protein ALOHA_HF400048F7ctg1g14 [uncultured marine microorganism HF4000_48F7]
MRTVTRFGQRRLAYLGLLRHAQRRAVVSLFAGSSAVGWRCTVVRTPLLSVMTQVNSKFKLPCLNSELSSQGKALGRVRNTGLDRLSNTQPAWVIVPSACVG